MAYTEVKRRGAREYYYRVRSVRDGEKVSKRRVYLGRDLTAAQLRRAEEEADGELGILDVLLTPEEIRVLDDIKKRHSSQPRSTVDNRLETFTTLYTHNSTAIEGNTLTLRETGSLLYDEVAPAERSMKDINEVLNHKKAFDHILTYKGDITKKLILELHRLVVRDTLGSELEPQIGRYRTVQVHIRGAEWLPPTPEDVPGDIRNLLSWYTKNKSKLHPLIVASYFHVGFETVHPFVDGNGRVGRLLLNFILHKNGFPMINIPNVGKNRYYEALEKGQDNGNHRPFVEYMAELLGGAEVLF